MAEISIVFLPIAGYLSDPAPRELQIWTLPYATVSSTTSLFASAMRWAYDSPIVWQSWRNSDAEIIEALPPFLTTAYWADGDLEILYVALMLRLLNPFAS